MANARFMEILRCWGVDETASPHPGMVVPLGGENQVVLETGGFDVALQSPVTLEEFKGGLDFMGPIVRDIRQSLEKEDADPQERAAYLPTTQWQKPIFYRVRGTKPTGFPGATVKAVPRPRYGQRPGGQATLQVAIVERLVVPIAIRNVKARDAQGQMRYHAKRPVDPAGIVLQMNSIWTPQTNIAFELIPSGDLEVDDRDKATQDGLQQAYEMKIAPTFTAESTVYVDKNSGWFARHRVPGAVMTFFVVHKLLSGGRPPYGRGGEFPNGSMNRPTGVSFICDSRLPSTFAHEAGHFLGDMEHEGQDIKLLMRGEGSGYKIPFDLARRFRQNAAKVAKK